MKYYMEKKLYPLKFIPAASITPWGGNALTGRLAKRFVEVDEQGNESVIGEDALVGESWEIADMGFQDSVVAEGWLAGNAISELMETYLERIVGETVYNFYGRQFPLLVKILDVKGKLPAQVHPDDDIAAQRYDALGRAKLWYVMDADQDAKIYCGFTREVSAQEFFDRCNNGTVYEILNQITPKKGDVLYVTPGTVHAAEGGLLLAEVQESSDLTFTLCGQGFDQLAEAIDIIDYRAFDFGLYKKGQLWGEEASCCPCHTGECDHDHDHGPVETLVESPQFNVSKLHLSDPLHIYTDKFESFIVYICIEGAASIQVPATKESGEAYMETYELAKGETVLVPAELPDFYLVPRDRSTVILEAVTRPEEAFDEYIDPNTEAFLENEDYEGLEDGVFDDDNDDDDDDFSSPSGASPLSFFS